MMEKIPLEELNTAVKLIESGKLTEAESTLLKLKDLFKDNLAIEIQPNNMQRGSTAYFDKIDQGFLNCV